MSNGGGDLNNASMIEGATDSTNIGNVGDRLKVDALVSVTSDDDIKTKLTANKIYSAATLANAASSAAENPLMLLRNPSGSGKTLYILMLVGNSTISNERTLFSVRQNPTITSVGSAITILSRNIGGGASASVALAYSLPTISVLGGVQGYAQAGENTNDQEMVALQQMAIKPGNDILITGQPKSNNRVQQVTVVWYEE